MNRSLNRVEPARALKLNQTAWLHHDDTPQPRFWAKPPRSHRLTAAKRWSRDATQFFRSSRNLHETCPEIQGVARVAGGKQLPALLCVSCWGSGKKPRRQRQLLVKQMPTRHHLELRLTLNFSCSCFCTGHSITPM